MRGSSRIAALAGSKALDAALASGVDRRALGDELLAVTGLVDGNATLRRALADPSREPQAKRELVQRVLGGKVSPQAVDVVSELVAQRWSTERDLSDTLENLGVESVLAAAEAEGRADAVEDELFRFERTVSGHSDLRDALTDRNADPDAKAALVSRLLEAKASRDTTRLARQAVLHPRGRRFDRSLEQYLRLAAKRREQLTAVVTAAVELDQGQRDRLARALHDIYGKTVLLQVVVDPRVVGGIRVQVGDEVVDGTILRRLDDAKRRLAG